MPSVLIADDEPNIRRMVGALLASEGYEIREASSGRDAIAQAVELEPDIAFWRKVDTEVTTEGGLLHDQDDLSVIYEVMKLPSDLSQKQRQKRIEDAKLQFLARQVGDVLPGTGDDEACQPRGDRHETCLLRIIGPPRRRT